MKILVIHASAGAGHRKAAEAIHKGLSADPSCQAVLVDALDYTSRFYKYLYASSYTFMISYIPWVWKVIFHAIDIRALLPLVRFLRRINNALNGPGLARFLIREDFDCIISTHFFPNEVAAYLKRTGKIRSKIISCITDFDVHTIWLAEGVDHYTGACDDTRRKLIELGVPANKTKVTGIPTDPKFSQRRDITALKDRLGLDQQAFTVLVATGSFGIGPIEEVLAALDGFQVLVVCGHNRSLYERLSGEARQTDRRARQDLWREKPLVKIYALVNNMDELMAVSDAMVTKPGGLSISEALVSGLGIIFFNAIPGQETGNIRVLQKYGIGLSGLTIPQMADVLKRWKSSPQELQDVQKRTADLAKPSAVDDIIALIH